ncbi:16S rRNA (guanine527-N7)-methyltransferase [Defluviimonas denitrificans]|jgi:16S rRNA (guanine527-N7)-methyltransferase|uniref:Ribosomal RNA small subunit methyltransferase G n=1 Tax=Albidovulum denitrificans TaxID=404881 RepID=A0A2S8S767_9RHOB|nr:16S rRNA (guanine(527)-N(7))-methyltransferase RsmG [Defluviimonas denitrificans]PQV56645.1 16S rRNA (guanine527-N7)-methyltransferase [Defluviimonas denitrificans]
MTGGGALLPDLDVSRETWGRLELYDSMLRKWNPAINLVSRTTLDDIWARHFLDSAQLFMLAPNAARLWADLGAGGGFPGLVIAILAQELRPGLSVTLVESDQRKCTFLREVARQTGTPVTVLTQRAEDLPPLHADIVSARALAPLRDLLHLAERHLTPAGTALFLKGANHDAELSDALETFRFTFQKRASQTDPQAVILSIGDLARE